MARCSARWYLHKWKFLKIISRFLSSYQQYSLRTWIRAWKIWLGIFQQWSIRSGTPTMGYMGGNLESLLETVQKVVTIAWTRVHRLAHKMWHGRYYLSMFIWFQEWAHLGPESTFAMHPQLRLFTIQLFLDFRAIICLNSPSFFGHHDSPSNLAGSRYPCIWAVPSPTAGSKVLELP